MLITTLSGKNQTTIGIEFIKALGLEPGTRLKQSLEGKRIVIEPVEDVMTAFGSLSGKGTPRAIRRRLKEWKQLSERRWLPRQA